MKKRTAQNILSLLDLIPFFIGGVYFVIDFKVSIILLVIGILWIIQKHYLEKE